MDDYGNIQGFEIDVLKEIGNIGAGNATTALSQMLNTKIDMKVPKVSIMEFPELAAAIGGEENPIVGILFDLSIDIKGMILFILEKEEAKNLLETLMGTKVGEDFSEMEISALKEIGNIISGAYVTSLSTLTGLRIETSIPFLSLDYAGAILSVPAIKFGEVGDNALLIETDFGGDKDPVSGYFILIPEIESYKKILKSLGLSNEWYHKSRNGRS